MNPTKEKVEEVIKPVRVEKEISNVEKKEAEPLVSNVPPSPHLKLLL